MEVSNSLSKCGYTTTILASSSAELWSITKAKTQDQVYSVFRCLCGEVKICDVRTLAPGLESHHVDVVDA